MKTLGNADSEQRRRLGDAKDVANITKQSARSVMRNADRGAMPFGFKLGALRRWDLDEIDRWITGGCKPVRTVTGKKVRA